jgi:hypothetical protein
MQIRFTYDDRALPVPDQGKDALNQHFLGHAVVERSRDVSAYPTVVCTVTFSSNIPEPALTGLVNALTAASGIDSSTIEVL